MRTVWSLVVFGSLIIHHCFTNVSGEGIPSGEAQPSYSQCKPYVDAALKGDIPSEDTRPPIAGSSKTSTDTTKGVPQDDHDDDSGEDEVEKKGQIESQTSSTKTKSETTPEKDDHDSSEEVIVRVQDDDGDDASEEKTGGKAEVKQDTDDDDDDSKEVKAAIDATQDTKTETVKDDDHDDDDSKEAGLGVEVVDDEDDDDKAKIKQEESQDSSSEESEEKDTKGKAGQDPSGETIKSAGRSDSLADKADQSKFDSKKEKEVEKTKSSSKASTTAATMKDSDEDDDDSHEEVKVEKKAKKSGSGNEKKKVELVDDDDDDSSEEKEAERKGKKSSEKLENTKKGKKVDDDDDDDSSEEKEVEKGGKRSSAKLEKTKGKKVENDDDDDDSSEEVDKTSKKPASEKEKAKKGVKVDDDDDSSEKEEVQSKTKKEKRSVDEPKGKSDRQKHDKSEAGKGKSEDADDDDDDDEDDDDSSEEEESYVPRSRDHLTRILGLDDSVKIKGVASMLDKVTQTTLKELKSIYENSIKPLETMYKYRDLSNRHYGDSEIFSKPMVVFMGPWSGGKSTIINWLLGIQNEEHALRTGADPSPAQFNIMVWGEEEEVLDGTQLAADWTFSGLQKFGQAYLDRLRGRKMPNRLLEKVNLVEIPGILEIRKQVSRSFPFNDACQWFIDRADVLFLVYDPAKLDIGPETEAILDQLKGRENQVRIILNKADSVKPEELLRVQATLVWNISPLMASAEPPILYAASLWDHPLQPDSPTALLRAHENQFLKDINDANEKRVETRIAAARRFAVRVRNHGKMVDCYLNTYNNHRSFFSNKKRISDDIIEHPQNYHIYEGLSTLTNISRYDLPDPDTYKDFFRLNPLWDFPTLASTCTYFRGCPINKLDIAIAYDLPELLGRYRRQRESILSAGVPGVSASSAKTQPHQQKTSKLAAPVSKQEKQKPPSKEEETRLKAEEEEVKKWNKWWKDGIPHPVRYSDGKEQGQDQGPLKNKWWKDGVNPHLNQKAEVKDDKQPKNQRQQAQEDKQPGKNKWWADGVNPHLNQKAEVKDDKQPKKNKWWKDGHPESNLEK